MSKETPVTEPYYESKDVLKGLYSVKRRWSIAEFLVQQHHIDYGKSEQFLEERTQLDEDMPDFSVALGSIFLRHLNIVFFAGIGVDPLEMAEGAFRE
jgi:hypothetical protein